MWTKLSDDFFRHPKVVQAGRDARDLFLVALCHANEHLTDGFVAASYLRRLAADAEIEDAERAVESLVSVGLFERTEGGWLIHDYLEYNPPAEKVQADRAAAKDRMARARRPAPPRHGEEERGGEDSPPVCEAFSTGDFLSRNGLSERSGEVRANTGRTFGRSSPRPVPGPVSRIPIPEASRQPRVVDTASARARDPDRRHRSAALHAGRLAAALAMPEGRGGEEAVAVPSPPAPPPAIDEVLARHPDLAAELQAIEARKLAKGESIGSPQRWRAAMLQSLLRQRAQRQAAGHRGAAPHAAAESPHADREDAVAARIVQAPRPRRPLPPDWLPGVEEEEARRLLNAAREALLCRRDPSPPGPERDAKLLALARGYWERAHPDQAPPWGAIPSTAPRDAPAEGHGISHQFTGDFVSQNGATQVAVREMAA